MGKVKKIVAVLLTLGLMAGCVPPECVRISYAAGTSGKGVIEYCSLDNKKGITNSAEEAFRACRYGGEIYFNADYHLDIKEWTNDLVCNARTLVVVRPGATLTLGKGGLKMGGQLQIWGTVDLEKSQGDLWGTEQVSVRTGGKLIKRPYKIERIGDTPFTAGSIFYGQPLSAAEIKPENIYWKSSIKGEWSFATPSLVYDMVGTFTMPAIFKPERPLTYAETFHASCVKIRVDRTYPKLTKCSVPEIHYGETLAGVRPEYSFVNPYSGEPVKGKLTFKDEREVLGCPAAEQSVLTIFTPDDLDSKHYTSAWQEIKVKVLPVVPEVVNYPQSCSQGKEGQLLQDIRLLPGKCRNPYTGGDIKGIWEWKEPLQKLQPGENSCSVLFVPEEKGYKKREGSITLKVESEGKNATEKPVPTPPSTTAPTAKPASPPPTKTVAPAPTKNPKLNSNRNSKVKTTTANGQDEEDRPPIIITRMVSRRSTIRFAKKKMLSAKAKIKKIKRSGNKAKVICKKISKVNYEVQYNVGKKWKSAKKKSFTNSVMTIRKLKSKKKYYFRVRVWKKSGKKKLYGKWSGAKRK